MLRHLPPRRLAAAPGEGGIADWGSAQVAKEICRYLLVLPIVSSGSSTAIYLSVATLEEPGIRR